MKETLEQILSAENSGRIKLEQAKEEAKAVLKEADIKVSSILKEATEQAHVEADNLFAEAEAAVRKEILKLEQDIDNQWHRYKDNKAVIKSAADTIIDFILP